MSSTTTALDLLKMDVPLALLFDIAGLGPSSEELYHSEVSRATVLPTPHLVAVAS